MSEYRISSRDYLLRAQEQLASGRSAGLFYAALEIRCGVEARLQEYLDPHEHIPASRRADWRVGNLHRTTQEAFSLGDQVARVQIADESSRTLIATLFYTPVSARLKHLAERFGNYLHTSKMYRPPGDPFWTQLRSELEEATRLLAEATTGTLLGPMLRQTGTTNANMPVELLPDGPERASSLLDLRGKELIMSVRYFPDLESALAAS